MTDKEKTLKESLEDGTVDKNLLLQAFGEVMGNYKEHSAKTNESEKKIVIGRNDPCPCGSGLKYKKCCGRNV